MDVEVDVLMPEHMRGRRLSCSKSEAKRLTKRKAMAVAAYNVWQDLHKIEEEAAKKAEEEGSSDEDGEVFVLEKLFNRVESDAPRAGAAQDSEKVELKSEAGKMVESGPEEVLRKCEGQGVGSLNYAASGRTGDIS